MEKILIIGASGYIGSQCFEYFNKSNFDVVGTRFKSQNSRLKFLDYTNDKDFIVFLKNSEPDVIIWCGGLKNLSITEKNLELSKEQNFHPIKTIIRYQKQNENLNFIYLSTDYVFNGLKGNYTTSDLPNPNTNYGISKLMSEKFIIENSKKFSIIRAGAVIGKGSLFFEWLIDKVLKNETIELFDNYFTPTPIINLLEAIKFTIIMPQNKILHISGFQKMSRYEFGLEIKKRNDKSNSKSIKQDCRLNDFNLLYDLSLKTSKEFEGLMDVDNFLNIFFKPYRP